MPDSISPKQAALWFASHGFAVLPLHSITEAGACTCGGCGCGSPGKHPYAALAPNGLKDATVDLDVIRGWFRESYWCNYGVVTDELLVIDVDKQHGGLETWAGICGAPTHGLIHTWITRTGNGGLHVMFKNTPKIRCGKLDGGVDVRGRDGYIVGAMCRHKSGARYEWLPQCSPSDTDLIEPPDWLLTVIASRSHLGRPTSLQEWRHIAASRVPDGERNTTLARFAGHLIANRTLDPIVARDLLLGWNRGMCDPPLPDARVIQLVEGLCERENQKDNWLCPKKTT